MTNPFEGHELSSPDLADADAHRLLIELFGLDGTLRPLGSHQDQNWRVDTERGRFVLKVSNPGFPRTGLEAQNAAMLYLADAGVSFDVPVPQPSTDGELIPTWRHGDRTFDIRLVTYVEGTQLADFPHLNPAVLRAHGGLAARAAVALDGFDHPGLDRTLQWDCRHAFDVVTALIHHVQEPDLRELVETHTERARQSLEPLMAQLRVGVVHADVTDVNVVATRDPSGRPMPHGLIDFGDISRTWLVSDAAVAGASLVQHDLENALSLVRDVIVGFHEVLPLTEVELDAVWSLVVARAALCVVSSEQQAGLEPHNQYAQDSRDSDNAIMRAVTSVSPMLACQVLRAAAGLPAPAPTRAPRLGQLLADQRTLARVDLSATSTAFAAGGWQQGREVERAIAQARQGATAFSGYRECRMVDTVDDSQVEPAATHLGVDLFADEGVEVLAPLDARVVSLAPLRLEIPEASHHLVLAGVDALVEVGRHVTAGAVVGHVSTAGGSVLPAHLHVQWVEPEVEAPRRCTAALADGWVALCPDPSGSLGIIPSPLVEPLTSSDLLAERAAVVAGVQEHYYEQPPRIERGWRHHLYDTDARSYLDMVNNVATLGHSHPAVATAVANQLHLLNTNSRFNYRAIVDYSRRLADLLPDPLDTVFLVNSGSEAVDLALRIARNSTQHEHVISVQSAYHGWTTATDAITTSLADNPQGFSNRPSWVHTVLSPNKYRGEHRGSDAAQRYADDVARAVAEIQAAGDGVAAFIAEALYGNAGGVLLPAGYLSSAYATVRQAGGLCIADEVQVGYGRTGHHFWAFEEQGVVPDIVTVAKAAGNGIALGAVVTSRAFADAFADQGSFFSSVGGSPVSCAAGLAVLDTMEAEGLQHNALVVGEHLRSRLEQLSERHELIGAVHGLGLYLGVELVRDRDSLEPATEETAAICDRMLELGIIVQPTADHLNVLKVKPPLCLTLSSADFFLDTLDEVLTNGW